ncbi:hypothetical protein EBU71_18820 [bacterium]|nr:hypothetical protein [Candidatus Elulimicrobium humile]
MIFKIDGCDQMYCMQCHTAFSWKTGVIETGRIHNPHYYEYLRNANNGVIPRELGDAPCGGMPDAQRVRQKFARIISQPVLDKLMSIIRIYHHVHNVELDYNTVDVVIENRDIRIKYLAGEIDELQFKRVLQQREKAANKKREVFMILQMFLQASCDIMQRLVVNHNINSVTIESFMVEFENLRCYVNSLCDKISSRYNNKTFKIQCAGIWSVY